MSTALIAKTLTSLGGVIGSYCSVSLPLVLEQKQTTNSPKQTISEVWENMNNIYKHNQNSDFGEIDLPWKQEFEKILLGSKSKDSKDWLVTENIWKNCSNPNRWTNCGYLHLYNNENSYKINVNYAQDDKKWRVYIVMKNLTGVKYWGWNNHSQKGWWELHNVKFDDFHNNSGSNNWSKISEPSFIWPRS